MAPSKSIEFQSRFQESLPVDSVSDNYPRQVTDACYSWVTPQKVSAPKLIAYSQKLADNLGFSDEFCQSEMFTNVFVGNTLAPGMKPYAMCYGGHQFGNWAGQLGDGRAINLGEYADPNGGLHAFQLKGAGPTPYSRTADGLAVLRSSLREFLCSEAMHHLGIPTTRALSIILTGEHVERDILYNGNPQMEPGAVVTRTAASFIRFGHFEIFSSRNDVTNLEKLVAHTIQYDYPHLYGEFKQDKKSATLKWFADVCERTCKMVVDWMRVGFVHGVMNTDNMSILGLTIDYGPYGWLDNFDPSWTPNTTDAQHRRYRYENQPAVAQWNLLQLANAIYPLIGSTSELENIVGSFRVSYQQRWLEMMGNKLGLCKVDDKDSDFFADLQQLLVESEIDMTNFYRKLPHFLDDIYSSESCSNNNSENNNAEIFDNEKLEQFLSSHSYQSAMLPAAIAKWKVWFIEYHNKIQLNEFSSEQRSNIMMANNPAFILRNYVAQLAIDQAHEGDYSLVHTLLNALAKPYDDNIEYAMYTKMRPSWALAKVGCSMLSCSS